jgi:nucleoside 2-deoxyribosyltransferase
MTTPQCRDARHPEGTSGARHVYLAGPLFSDAERQFNLMLAARLETAGYTVFLPQRDVPQDTREAGHPARIFQADVQDLAEADVVVAVCDGIPMDDGTAWEIGYAWARGIPVIGLRTDTRTVGPQERVNLMIQESLTLLVDNIDSVLQELGGLSPSS